MAKEASSTVTIPLERPGLYSAVTGVEVRDASTPAERAETIAHVEVSSGG